MIIATVFAGLLFELKISTGEDDASYILAAQKFLDNEAFPTWHGSFYPIFLSFFLKLFGLKLVIFKLVSFVMIIAHIFITYYAFRLKVSWTVLLGTIIYTSVCLEILYFAGQTYSEALYFLLQISAFAAFYKLFDKEKEFPKKVFKQWKEWVVFGFLLFLLTITRNVGWSMVIAVLIYFAIIKKFRNILATIFSILIFYIPFNLYKIAFWNVGGAGFEGQFEKMFWVNPYDASMGTENFSGFITRFIENSELYLSKHLLIVLGWKNSFETSSLITILIFAAFIFSAIIIFKKRKELIFPIIYLGIALAVTFVTQQTFWDQIRLVLIYAPLIVLLFSSALSDFFYNLKNKKLKFIPIIFLLAVIVPSAVKTVEVSIKHYPMLKANFEGDKFYGYSPDWKNYFEMVEWTSENVPSNEIIGCRKPGMAFIYGNGRKFAGIYSFESHKIEDVIENLQNEEAKPYNYAFDFMKDSENFYTLYPYFKTISAVITQESGEQFIVFSMDKETNDDFEPILKNSGAKHFTLEQLNENLITTRENDYAVYPDSLLNYLKEREIDFLIAARIRKLPEQKTEHYITTIHRYIYFIELKYPGIFALVWQVGKNNDEPAMLVKINYNKL